MASAPQSTVQSYSSTNEESNTTPLIIVTILFFMWGLLTSLNDILIPHLKSVYSLTYVQAMLVQFCFFGAYFVVSLPAGFLIKKVGYQAGAVIGLIIASCGCALFYPAATNGYWVFLLALFILASGITILQVAANPYVTILGPAKTASSRLTLTQAFNSLGTVIGPFAGGILILAGTVLSVEQLAALPQAEVAAYHAKDAASVQIPYLGLALALLGLALFFAFAKLPKISHSEQSDLSGALASNKESALSHSHLLLGAVGIFVYVGAEVSIGSLLISFVGQPDIAGLSSKAASPFVSCYMLGAMAGRFLGFFVMRKISPGKALAFNSCAAIILILTAMFTNGYLAMAAIIAVGLCNSIMFPTIFSLALHNLGKFTGQGSGILCMAIVGGALIPFTTGFMADLIGVQLSFFVPAICYLFILFFGLKFANLHTSTVTAKEPAHI